MTYNSFTDSYGLNWVLLHPTKNIYFIEAEWGNTYAVNFDYYYETQYPIPFETHGTLVDETNANKVDMWISNDGKFLFSL